MPIPTPNTRRPAMLGGGDQRRVYIGSEPASPLPNNSRALVAFDPSALEHSGENSTFPKDDMQSGAHRQKAEYIITHSKKLQDDLQEVGQKVKHHEDNIRYLKTLKNNLEDSIRNMQVDVGKHHSSFSTSENDDIAYVNSEEETVQHILRYEKSAAALLCRLKSKPEAQVLDYPFTNDVLGIVATLGKVDDDNLSRLLSEYLGLETMLAVVCKTYEGVKALEAYNHDGSINKNWGLHAVAASTGRPLDRQFQVICLENLRPYAGEVIADDPQRKLALLEPKLLSGETPPGFLGFAVNLVTIDNTSLYCITTTGYSLRETLFYNLFSTLQIYRSREDMLKSLSCITNGAISLDGGLIRSPGVFSLGHQRGDIDVKFPSGSKRFILPASYIEIEKQMKEMEWKKEQAEEDLKREQALLNHAKVNYERKKEEFIQFMANSSSYTTQYQMGRVSTPR
ncbi:hypothetical protein ACJIZ3_022658 [Penstemon smallii]|uniref:Protein DEFECTIVE IN MERISTEM SILENCING 3-like n=1 Tax=Penstemon smallii TaxID=265156 RepID=A0ABD3TLV3_9LAMI